MQNFKKVRKPRSDSTLDSHLTDEQAQNLARRLEHGTSLREAADWLQAEFGIRLSRVSISRWAARRRRARTELTFASLMEMVQQDQAGAKRFEERSPDSFHKANELIVSRALFAAQVNQDPEAIRQAARLFTRVMGAVVRERRAETHQILAELQLQKRAAQEQRDAAVCNGR